LRHLLFGLLAGVAFVACTNYDDPAGASPVNGDNKVATADKYISVNLKMPAGAATRVQTEAGSEAENEVKKATFLFFKDGSQIADPFTIEAGGQDKEPAEWTPGTAAVKEALIVMKNPTDIPTSLVVLINYAGNVAKTQTLAQLQAIVADYADTTNGFVMSNAVYNDASNANVIGAPVAPENVCETPALAKQKPVKVYVERVLAKVTVDKAENASIDSGVEGIDVDITGWNLVYDNTQSYLIKKLNTSYDYDWYNDPTNHRSYWAEAATYKKSAGTAYNAALALKAVAYTQENTAFQTFTEGAESNPTAVVVNATLKKNGSAVDLYKFRGIIYEAAALKTLLANGTSYFKKTTTETATTYTKLVADDFDLEIDATAGESYEAKVNLKLASSVTGDLVDANKEAVTADAVNTALADAAETLEFWKGGATYYYVPIKQHAKDGANDKDVYGIVRNHFYKLNITKVQGLGTAVPDPAQIIDPITPEDSDYYIAAEINILDWALVEQEVNLGGE
ncbi:MAG: Mfa1 fimbrilin C-terminal domain-containing protein, partial [Butyrivibrio sp.]|nr:Mfa1 fimbrilin C-terminal domain-containing protein [Butyrivibrio sp.]